MSGCSCICTLTHFLFSPIATLMTILKRFLYLTVILITFTACGGSDDEDEPITETNSNRNNTNTSNNNRRSDNSSSSGLSGWMQKLIGAYNGTSQKYYGDSPALTDSESQILDAGRFVNGLEILKRFRFGNEWGTTSANDVFAPGFEDPTHLSFKIEFGEWGGSISDMSTIRAIQKSSYSSSVINANYD